MAYIDVLPLAEAKIYLRIDDTQNDTDAEITSMINSAFKYIENHTNQYVYARDKDFVVQNQCVRVYDTPINSIIAPASGVTSERKNLYRNYTIDNPEEEILTLNVGYVLPADVPSDLIDLAKLMVDVMFYQKDSDKPFKEMLPSWAQGLLSSNKRFII